jgi:Zn-dependent protease with chaperone function
MALPVWCFCDTVRPPVSVADRTINRRKSDQGTCYHGALRGRSTRRARASRVRQSTRSKSCADSDSKVPVTAKLIHSNEVNAFALPGRGLFVNSGLLQKADAEAELVGAIAHEIAHVAARHATRQASRGQVIDTASLPLSFLGGWAGYAGRQRAGLVVPLTFLKFLARLRTRGGSPGPAVPLQVSSQ